MPTESALATASIQVEQETLNMLAAIGLKGLEGVTLRPQHRVDRK
jgi:hypothetical protein